MCTEVQSEISRFSGARRVVVALLQRGPGIEYKKCNQNLNTFEIFRGVRENVGVPVFPSEFSSKRRILTFDAKMKRLAARFVQIVRRCAHVLAGATSGHALKHQALIRPNYPGRRVVRQYLVLKQRQRITLIVGFIARRKYSSFFEREFSFDSFNVEY